MPPTSDDDNPFQRPSAWPRLPQGPFRIGPLPKASAPAPVRPVAAPRPQQQSQQQSGPAAAPSLFGASPMDALMARPAAAPAPPPAAPEPEPEPALFLEPEPMQFAAVEVVARRRAPPPADADDADLSAPFAPLAMSATRRRNPNRVPLIVAGPDNVPESHWLSVNASTSAVFPVLVTVI